MNKFNNPKKMNKGNFRKITLTILSGVIFLLATGSNNFSSEFKISKSLQTVLNSQDGREPVKVWIEFSDKGSDAERLLSNPALLVTQRSLDRRTKVRPENPVDFTDVPVNQEYVDEIVRGGIRVVNKSKWFNRVSVYANEEQIRELAGENFVRKIDLVMKLKKSADEIEYAVTNEIPESDNNGFSGVQSLNYGASLDQMQIINAVTAHDSGYFGEGILIASFDTGAENLQHPAFDSLRARGFRSYDFVNHDTIVGNQSGQMGEGSHGAKTLSLVGGYRPGNLISPAFRSDFIIAKTENTDSETPLEEDNWLAAAEWVDSLGADIITSSLGYLDMDPGSIRSYDWTWMNGDSCVITIGADLAVNKGILIFNSAGNEGSNSSHNTLIAPADGDSVITIGSVNSNRNRSSFSSVGPTTDGRIKPDVCALGSGNVVVNTNSGSTGYSSGSGTSFSCPMTAGAAALVLSANPSLTPMQVRDILRQTADSSFAPNNRRGWGLINTWEAIKVARMMTGISAGTGPETVDGYELSQNFPNPFNPSTKINYKLKNAVRVKLEVFDVSGRIVRTLVDATQSAGNYSIDFTALELPSGAYFYSLVADGERVGIRMMLLIK